MGDHRGDSDDSRYHSYSPGGGAVPESEVVGRAFLVIWPLSQFRDLPIPGTFQQAALSAAASVPVSGAVGAAGVIGVPLLLLRRRRR
jgi:signal peptidase I